MFKHLSKAIVVLLSSIFWLGAVTTSWAADIAVTQPTGNVVVGEAADFATRRFADPWDMSQYTDASHGEYTGDIANISWRNGMLSGTTSGGDSAFHPLFPGYEGVLFNGRDGYINRINTSTYNRFSLRMYADRPTKAQVLWFYNQRWSDVGEVSFWLQPGWHTYNIDLTKGRWTGEPMGLRFDPANTTGVNFKVDWMRLYQNTGRRVRLAWSDRNPGSEVEIYLDKDRDPDNGKELIATQTSGQSNTYDWDFGPYPPRSYYFFVKKPGQAGVYSPRVFVNPEPRTRILNPDERGGRDYATAVSGDPWDMSQPSDVWFFDSVKDISFAGGVLAGTPTNGDGFFHLRVPAPIDTNKYHRLTWRFRYDGPFDYGAGTMSRIIWSPDHNTLGLYQVINDIVTYPRWTTYTIDLKKVTLDAGSIGWNGYMNDFRFDPSEWMAQWRFYVDYIRLAADDEANRSFTIKWRDARSNPRPTKVSLFYDTNRRGFDGRRIVKGLSQVAGKTNKYTWNTSNVPAGTYWVYAIANDGVSRTKVYSSGPVVISH